MTGTRRAVGFAVFIVLGWALPSMPVAVAHSLPQGRSTASPHEVGRHTRVVERNGRRLTISTHGDPASALAAESGTDVAGQTEIAPAAGSPSLASTWCGSERTIDYTAASLGHDPAIKVVYAYPTDQHNFGTYANLIQTDIKSAVDRVASAPGATKTLRFDLGTDCPNPLNYVDIESVALAHPAGYYQNLSAGTRFSTVRTEVAAAVGPQEGARNYAIFGDDIGQVEWYGYSWSVILGLGESVQDDAFDLGNGSNYSIFDPKSSLYAEVFGLGGPGFFAGHESFPGKNILHEITHTLGAVQNSAPHSTGASHCFDQWDVMCYPDGGPRSTMTYPCASLGEGNAAYDCNEDDYLNPAPAPGSYLATHWNAQQSVFLCPLGRCQTPDDPPVVSVRVCGTDAAACAANCGNYDNCTSGVVAGQPAVISAARSTDDAGIASYAFDLDGNRHFEKSTGTSPAITTTFAKANELGTWQWIGVAVTDTDGAATAKQVPVFVAAPPAHAKPPSSPPTGPGTPAPPSHNVTQQGAHTWTGCVVPRLRGSTVKKAVRKLRRAGCRYHVRGKGRVIAVAPRAGIRTTAVVLVRARAHRSSRLRRR
jgi:hypothetical protein